MNEKEYRDFYDRVGQSNGWDFSKLQCRVEGNAAHLYEEVLKVCKRSDLLLDIGTGGGEALLAIRDSALLLVGIDLSSGMIQTAKANLRNSGAPNVRFIQMDAEKLDFPDRFFNVVSCRHTPRLFQILDNIEMILRYSASLLLKIKVKREFGQIQSDL